MDYIADLEPFSALFCSYYQISSDASSNKLLTNEEKMIFYSVSIISMGFKIRHYLRQVFAITRNFIGLHIKSQVSASKTSLRTKRSGVRIPCSAPKTVEPVRVRRFLFSLSGIRRTNDTEQRSGGAL